MMKHKYNQEPNDVNTQLQDAIPVPKPEAKEPILSAFINAGEPNKTMSSLERFDKLLSKSGKI